MKNLRQTIGAFAFAAILTFTGCQKEDIVPVTDETALAADDSLQITELEDIVNVEVSTASQTKPFSTSNTDTKHNPRGLRYILHQLNLREKQVAAVKSFITQYKECIAEHHERIKLYQQELIARANALREVYINEYKAGTITKHELEMRLYNLREKLVIELRKHSGIQAHAAVIRRCRATLFAKIEAILGPDQLAIWLQWKNGL